MMMVMMVFVAMVMVMVLIDNVDDGGGLGQGADGE